jgi:carnitine O-acetyltransferase
LACAGLRLLIKEGENKPQIFTDPAYSRSCHWNLSTSQLTSEYFDGYGWGEVVPDGYGVAYMIKDQSIHFNVGCLVEMDGKGLHDQLFKACKDMQEVCEAALQPKAKL